MPNFFFGRLVAVRIAAQGDRQAFPAGVHQEFPQQFRCVFFHDNLSLEIQAGAVAPVFMDIPRITVRAAVLATLVGVHTIPHANVGAVHFIDDALGIFFQVLCFNIRLYPIVDGFDMFFYRFVFEEAVLWVDLGASSLQILNGVHFFSIGPG